MATRRKSIVIDGSNVAMSHGHGKKFSWRGIEMVVDYFKVRGFRDYDLTIIVPEWRTRHLPYREKCIAKKLKGEGMIEFSPPYTYDDRFVLSCASRVDGIVVTNDKYRDLYDVGISEWKKLIDERLLKFSFVGGEFTPANYPLGEEGPTLNQFLGGAIPRTQNQFRSDSTPAITHYWNGMHQPWCSGEIPTGGDGTVGHTPTHHQSNVLPPYFLIQNTTSGDLWLNPSIYRPAHSQY